MKARREDGVAAECLLAALGRTEDQDDPGYVSAYVGALLLAEGLQDLRITRQAWTEPPKKG